MRLISIGALLISTAFLSASEIETTSNDPLVLQLKIDDMRAFVKEDADMVAGKLCSGVEYTVAIGYHIRNISSTNIVIGETASWMLREEWQLEYPPTQNTTFQDSWRDPDTAWGHPPYACDVCGKYTTLASGQSTNLGQLRYTFPLRATAAVCRASLSLMDDGHSCGLQAWTGSLHAASLHIALTTNTIQKTQPIAPAKGASPERSP